VQGNAEYERSIEHGAPDGPAMQRSLDVLKVEFGRRRDATQWREAVDDHVDGKEEGGGVAGHGERTGEWSWRFWREKSFEENTRGVYQ
jgi:hypothetical protein